MGRVYYEASSMGNTLSNSDKNLHIPHEIEIIFLPQCLGTFLNQLKL